MDPVWRVINDPDNTDDGDDNDQNDDEEEDWKDDEEENDEEEDNCEIGDPCCNTSSVRDAEICKLLQSAMSLLQ